MSIAEKLTQDMKQAMKDKEAGKLRLSVIRMAKASIKYAEIEKQKELSDEEILAVLAKETKMRRDSLAEFQKGNRPDLVENIKKEIQILADYLPPELTEAEIKALVEEAVQETGASSAREMGKVMAALMPKVKGRADGKLVNALVKAALNN